MSLLREAEPGAGLGTLCGLFGYSRQTYYKRGEDNDFKPLALEPMIVEKVKDYRRDNPRLGSVKLWMILKKQFEDTGCFPGRDTFIELLHRHGLMVKVKRRRHYATTDSNHNYRRYPNLVKGMTDMIADCEEYGLRTPEFIQAEDFRTIIWRKGKVTEQGEKVTEQGAKVIEQGAKNNSAEQKSNRVHLTAKQQKVLEFCDEVPRTAQEILEMVGVKYQTRTLQQYVTKLVLAGVLRPTTTHKNDSNRKYITAHDRE